jgi:hypothetical protein
MVFAFSTQAHAPLMTKNLLSVEQFRQDTLEKLQSEVSMGRILGPFSRLPKAATGGLCLLVWWYCLGTELLEYIKFGLVNLRGG